MKIDKLLILLEKNELISPEQKISIAQFMKQRKKEQFFRLLKWISIIGVCWLIFGTISLIINFFKLDFMEKILKFLISFFKGFFEIIQTFILSPIYNFVHQIFKENTHFFFWAVFAFIVFLISVYFIKKHDNKQTQELKELTEEEKYFIKTSYPLEFLANFSLASVFCLLNMLLLKDGDFYSDDKIFPVFNFLGALVFIFGAYKYKKPMTLLFGIYFIALAVGLFFGYGFACYWIGASRPLIQLFVGIILAAIGHITLRDLKEEDIVKEKFAQTYFWTGLFFSFIALWIMSFWGFDLDLQGFESKFSDIEIWLSNILFILASIVSMFYGAKYDRKIFFDYGLTFLIIETYTIFCSRIWDNLDTGLAGLILGIMLLSTVKLLKKIYFNKKEKINVK